MRNSGFKFESFNFSKETEQAMIFMAPQMLGD